MSTQPTTPATAPATTTPIKPADHLRFHRPHFHLSTPFGNDAFALKAEAFARFFGTPLFLGGQTLVVAIWIAVNASGAVHFDAYPFILLNLAFSLQAAYAAPLILLAQTRQAARDKAQSDADAQHREALATSNADRQREAAETAARLLLLLEHNTALTEATRELSARIESLTRDVHTHILQGASGSPSTQEPGR
jgi:uncharacterized membrane protein